MTMEIFEPNRPIDMPGMDRITDMYGQISERIGKGGCDATSTSRPRRSLAVRPALLRLLPLLPDPWTSYGPLSAALPSSTTAVFERAVVSPLLS
ncbi:hypothetical protein ANO14919_069950 [Xylariales sp. No.14919]|nr:hypothetical protein ANO14919_069950 [Xylariales sp. No.14919]